MILNFTMILKSSKVSGLFCFIIVLQCAKKFI